MLESKAAGKWIRESVEEATGLKAYDEEHSGFKPDVRAVIVYSLSRDDPRRTSNGLVMLRRQTWQVLAIVAANDPDKADDYSEVLHDTLHGKLNQEDVEGCTILQSIDVGPALKFSSRDTSGAIYRHAGSMYELWIRKTVGA